MLVTFSYDMHGYLCVLRDISFSGERTPSKARNMYGTSLSKLEAQNLI